MSYSVSGRIADRKAGFSGQPDIWFIISLMNSRSFTASASKNGQADLGFVPFFLIPSIFFPNVGEGAAPLREGARPLCLRPIPRRLAINVSLGAKPYSYDAMAFLHRKT